jgi:hypothetical protein
MTLSVTDPAKARPGEIIGYRRDGRPIRLIAGGHTNPNYVQSRFRARGDTVGLNVNTWDHALDTNWSQPVDETFRLRIVVVENAGGGAGLNAQLQFSLNGGLYTSISTTSAVVKGVNSGQFANNDTTTSLLGSGTFVIGYGVTDGLAPSVPFAGNDYTEWEFSLQIVGADVSNGDTIDFQILGLNSYAITPRATAVEGATPVEGQGTGDYSFTGAASGIPETFGTAAGDLTFTGSASGSTATTVTGTAEGIFAWSGTATGAPRTPGTGTGSYAFSGAASGLPDVQGSGSSTITFTGSAAGIPDVQGAAAASLSFTGSASGTVAGPAVTGTGSGDYTFTGTAAGIPDVQGVATVSLTFTGSAAGEVGGVTSGTGLGAYTFTGTASGTPDVHGTAAAALAFSGVAAGVRVRLGQAVTTLTFNGAALGAPVLFGQGAVALTFTGAATGFILGEFPDPNPLHFAYVETTRHGTYNQFSHIVHQEEP